MSTDKQLVQGKFKGIRSFSKSLWMKTPENVIVKEFKKRKLLWNHLSYSFTNYHSIKIPGVFFKEWVKICVYIFVAHIGTHAQLYTLLLHTPLQVFLRKVKLI